MLEIIGGIAVTFGCFWLFISYQNSLDEKRKKRALLIENSPECRDLIYNFKRKGINNSEELQRQLDEILNRKGAEEAIMNRIEKKNEERRDLNKRLDDAKILAIKYELVIYKIFHTDVELPKDKIIMGIQKELQGSSQVAEVIFLDWEKHFLINICPWNSSMFCIGEMLEEEFISSNGLDKLVELHIPRKTWLKNNNLTLKEYSRERRSYELDDDFEDLDDYFDEDED